MTYDLSETIQLVKAPSQSVNHVKDDDPSVLRDEEVQLGIHEKIGLSIKEVSTTFGRCYTISSTLEVKYRIF